MDPADPMMTMVPPPPTPFDFFATFGFRTPDLLSTFRGDPVLNTPNAALWQADTWSIAVQTPELLAMLELGDNSAAPAAAPAWTLPPPPAVRREVNRFSHSLTRPSGNTPGASSLSTVEAATFPPVATHPSVVTTAALLSQLSSPRSSPSPSPPQAQPQPQTQAQPPLSQSKQPLPRSRRTATLGAAAAVAAAVAALNSGSDELSEAEDRAVFSGGHVPTGASSNQSRWALGSAGALAPGRGESADVETARRAFRSIPLHTVSVTPLLNGAVTAIYVPPPHQGPQARVASDRKRKVKGGPRQPGGEGSAAVSSTDDDHDHEADKDHDELSVDDLDGRDPDEVKRRRAINRVAAAQCRQRKLDKEATLRGALADLHAQHASLMAEYEVAHARLAAVQAAFVQHCQSACVVTTDASL